MEYYNIDDNKAFTREVQKMLRYLSQWEHEPELYTAEDGSFDEGTQKAVAYFQRLNSLPVTGKVDLGTWNELYRQYEISRQHHDRAMPITPFPSREGFKVQIGERSDLVLLIQMILDELRINYGTYGYIPPNGRFNLATAAAVREFQRINGLPTSGIVDRPTWNRMAEQYNNVTK